MEFIKKHIWNILFGVFIVVIVFNPFGLGMEIKSKFNRLVSFSPNVIKEADRETLTDYNWDLLVNDSEAVDFNQFKGKVVLVNFWATWCPPCIAEMPSLHDLYNDYSDKIEFVLVANDNPTKVNAFMRKNGYSFPIYYEESLTPELLMSSSIPATFLIDKEGKIIIKKMGSADWNSEKTREIIDALL